MNFETQIQQWVSVDNQLKKVYEQAKELREKRNNTCLQQQYDRCNNQNK